MTINIVDDDAAVRDSWARLLMMHGFETRQYPDAHAYLEGSDRDSNDCVLLDIRMPGLNGLELQTELRRRGREEAIVFVTGHGDIALAVKAMKAGAANFLQKPCAEDELIEAVRDAMTCRREIHKSDEARQKAQAALSRLTDREREVLGYVSKGLTSKMIARYLGISERTVDIHRASMMLKTGTRNVVELVRVALAAGLVPN